MSDDSCCPLIELRQYTLQPGQRDVLIDLFDREFVETQEATGMCLVGQFRDVERPDRFVWIRGFPDMPARATSLQAFYGGPVWAAHREAANATMIDSDDVLLLRPATAKSAFARNDSARAPVDASERPASRIVATIFHFDYAGRCCIRAFLRGGDRARAFRSRRAAARAVRHRVFREHIPSPAGPHRRERVRLVRPFRRRSRARGVRCAARLIAALE